MLGLGLWRVEPERGGDQRSEILDVGAHHDDVARLKGGIVSKQADEHLPQHLHLTVGAVAGVELHAAVVVLRGVVAPRSGPGARLPAMSDCSQPSRDAGWLGFSALRDADPWHRG